MPWSAVYFFGTAWFGFAWVFAWGVLLVLGYTACVCLALHPYPPSQIAEVHKEVDMLKRLRHANIVSIIEDFRHAQYSCIVMQFCGGGVAVHPGPLEAIEPMVYVLTSMSCVVTCISFWRACIMMKCQFLVP